MSNTHTAPTVDQVLTVPVPAPGMGATLVFPSDMYPLRIKTVSPSGHRITLADVETVSTLTGHAPADYAGPYPVWDHTYTDDELVELERTTTSRHVTATRRTDGCYYLAGTTMPVVIGTARYRRDYSE